jgi:hypothetical protein
MNPPPDWNDEAFDQPPRGFGGPDEQAYPEERQKPKKSLAVRLLIAFSILGALMCCGCCGFGVWWAQSIEPNTDPAAVQGVARDLLKREVPADLFSPEMTLEMKFFSLFQMRMGLFSSQQGEGVLMLIQMRFPTLAGQEAQIEQGMRQQKAQGSKQLIIEETETRMLDLPEIGEVPFQFSRGKDPQSNKDFRQIEAVLPSEGGAAMFLLQLEESAYDEARILEWLTGDANALQQPVDADGKAGGDGVPGEVKPPEAEEGQPAAADRENKTTQCRMRLLTLA